MRKSTTLLDSGHSLKYQYAVIFSILIPLIWSRLTNCLWIKISHFDSKEVTNSNGLLRSERLVLIVFLIFLVTRSFFVRLLNLLIKMPCFRMNLLKIANISNSEKSWVEVHRFLKSVLKNITAWNYCRMIHWTDLPCYQFPYKSTSLTPMKAKRNLMVIRNKRNIEKLIFSCLKLLAWIIKTEIKNQNNKQKI